MHRTSCFLVGGIALALLGAGCSQESPGNPVSSRTNSRPVIRALIPTPASVEPGESSLIECTATDSDKDNLTYEWSSYSGYLSGNGPKVVFTSASCHSGNETITVKVSDGRGGEASKAIVVSVSFAQEGGTEP